MPKAESHPFTDFFCKNATDELSAGEIRKACIEELRVHYAWYDTASRRQKVFWFVTTIISAVLGGAVTVAVALGGAQHWLGQVAIAIVSAIATGLTSLLATFATRDAWQLREDGRIAINELMARACEIADDQPKTALAEAVKLLNKAHAIEKDQAQGFFGFLMQRSDSQRPPADKGIDKQGQSGPSGG